MLQRIIDFSIRNKLVIGLGTLALIIFGIFELFKLPIDAVPDITNNQVQIITTSPSLGAPDVERLITFPIEQASNNIPGLHEIRSFSRFGLSLVTLVFNDDVDIYWARQQVAERLIQAQDMIPPGVGTPTLGPVTTGLGEIYQYVVKPSKGYENQFNSTDLRTIQDWIVRRQLLGVKGVADVSSFGGKLKQYEVAVDPAKLSAQNLSVADVLDAIEKNNQNTGGSYIEKANQVHFIRTEGLVNSIEDIENICLRSEGSSPIYVRDIAEVRYGNANRYGAMAYNDQGEVAGAIVMMLKGENSREVIAAVKERIERIKKTLPKGVEIEPFLDRTKMVNNAISTVSKNLIEGALIVIFILVLVLGNFRAGFLVASVIPLAMLFAIILMNIFGVSGNLMSLGALDFGLIVDGAVIIVEAVLHQISLKKHKREMMGDLVSHSASKMMNSAVFGQIIILVVYLPIFSLEGIEGKMFKPMAQTVAFALLGAFVLSLTYIPMMSAWLFKNTEMHHDSLTERGIRSIQKAYAKALQWVFKHPKWSIGGTLGMFVLAILCGSQLGGEFIPTLEEGDFAVESRILTGSNLQTTLDATQKAAGILKANFPEVEKVVTKIGSGEIPTDPMPIEAADMMIILKDKKEWTSAKSFDELSEKMQAKIDAVPGLSTGFQYPVQMRFNELMTGAKQDVVCKIFGEDLYILTKYAEKLGKIAQSIDGATDIYVEATQGMPQIVVKYNRDALAKYKGNIKDINRMVNATFAGEVTGQVFEGERRFDLVVRMANEQRQSIEALKNLLVPVGGGQRIPLYLLANIESFDGVNQIQREDAKRRIIVGFNIKDKDVQTVVKELQSKVSQQIRFPSGYYITYGGSFENLEKAKKRLGIAVPIALLLIFILLFFAFHSVKHGLLIYTAIPLSAMGGLFALTLRGMPFSISAGIGFIALFGVAVLNGIVLIAEFNRLKMLNIHGLKEVIFEGAKTRLRPVMITALVASLGFLPMALSSGSGAEVQKPLATVVIGGLIFATLLTLLILPLLYYLFEKRSQAPAPKIVVLFLVCLSLGSLKAQQPLSLKQAVDSAKNNNPSLKIQQNLLQQFQVGAKQQPWLGNTTVVGGAGQINSYYSDNQLGVQQVINWPGQSLRQKQLNAQSVTVQSTQVQLSERDLIVQVEQAFVQQLFFQEKLRILKEQLALSQEAFAKAKLQTQKGQQSAYDLVAFELQINKIQLDIFQAQTDYDGGQSQLKQLLKIGHISGLEPILGEQDLAKSLQPLSVTLPINLAQQQLFLAHKAKQLESSKLFPTLTLGYLNTSFAGYQNIHGTDQFFTKSDRFFSYQLSLSAPLFLTGQHSRIKQVTLSETAAKLQLDKVQWELQQKQEWSAKVYQTSGQLLQIELPRLLEQVTHYREMSKVKIQTGDIDPIDYTRIQEQILNLNLTISQLKHQHYSNYIQYLQYHEN